MSSSLAAASSKKKGTQQKKRKKGTGIFSDKRRMIATQKMPVPFFSFCSEQPVKITFQRPMIRTPSLLFCFFIVGALNSVGTDAIDMSPFANPDSRYHLFPPQQGGPVFVAKQDGIKIFAQFPSVAKDLNHLGVTIALQNLNTSDLVIHDFRTGFYGLDFQLEDSSHHEIEASPKLRSSRIAGRKGHSYFGWNATILKPGDTLRISVPIIKLLPFKDLGSLTFHVTWTNSEFLDGLWMPSDAPSIVLQGRILLQKTSKGISVTALP